MFAAAEEPTTTIIRPCPSPLARTGRRRAAPAGGDEGRRGTLEGAMKAMGLVGNVMCDGGCDGIIGEGDGLARPPCRGRWGM